jgi:hypothetical protein
MICQFCSKEIFNKGGFSKHVKGCKLNPNRIHYPTNFHKSVYEHSNQYIKAKKENRAIVVSEEIKKVLNRSGKKLSNATKELLSKARAKQLEELGTGGFKFIKHFSVQNINNETFFLRGTWELKVSEWLNERKILWVRKQYLVYNDNGVNRTYVPDFYLPVYDVYLEVKGFYSDKDKRKMQLLKEQTSYNIHVLHGKKVEDITAAIPSLL